MSANIILVRMLLSLYIDCVNLFKSEFLIFPYMKVFTQLNCISLLKGIIAYILPYKSLKIY